MIAEREADEQGGAMPLSQEEEQQQQQPVVVQQYQPQGVGPAVSQLQRPRPSRTPRSAAAYEGEVLTRWERRVLLEGQLLAQLHVGVRQPADRQALLRILVGMAALSDRNGAENTTPRGVSRGNSLSRRRRER